MKKKFKILIIVEIILIILLVLPIIFNTFNFFFLIVSDSMNPQIYKNDIVIVKNINKELSEYDNKVIAFFDPIKSKIIVHRVVGFEDGYLVTKGDNSDFVDTFRVSEKRIIGEIIYVIPASKIFK